MWTPAARQGARPLSQVQVRALSFGTFGRMLGRGLRVPLGGAAIGAGGVSAMAYQLDCALFL